MKRLTLFTMTTITTALTLLSCQSFSSNEDQSAAIKRQVSQVYISDGSVQCQNLSRSLDDSKLRLLEQGVDVVSGQCAQLTGVHFMSVCGGLNGKVHVFEVTDVERAIALGFKAVSDLPKGQGVNTRPCP
jgi:hypothetical protein